MRTALVLFLVGAFLVPLLFPPFYLSACTLIAIDAIFALSLNLVTGYGGLYSLGHSAYFGFGAYIFALVATHYQVSTLESLVLGIVFAGCAGAVTGLLLFRTRALYFIMVTLAIAQILAVLSLSYTGVTGGSNGVIAPERLFGLGGDKGYYLLVAGILALVWLGFWRASRSPFILALEGTRENEQRMTVLGFNVWAYRYVGHVVGALVAGLAGGLLASYNGFVSPQVFSVETSAAVLLMVIVGGAGTVAGPVVGAVIVGIIQYIGGTYTQRIAMVLGAVYIVTILLAREGIVRKIADLVGPRRHPEDSSSAVVGMTPQRFGGSEDRRPGEETWLSPGGLWRPLSVFLRERMGGNRGK